MRRLQRAGYAILLTIATDLLSHVVSSNGAFRLWP